MSLERFKEPITVADEVIHEELTAYRMDNEKNDMRKAAKLGACSCCDYFLPRNGAVILIEETRLSETVETIRAEFSYLKNEKKNGEKKINEIVNEKIKDEHQLKAYGAMLVLSRLAVDCTDAKKLFHGEEAKKFEFWLVASRIDTPDKQIYFDSQKANLKRKLTDSIGGTLKIKVEVLSSKDLKARLSNNATTP